MLTEALDNKIGAAIQIYTGAPVNYSSAPTPSPVADIPVIRRGALTRSTGDFAPTAPDVENNPASIDERRLFYITETSEGQPFPGGFKMDWSRWRTTTTMAGEGPQGLVAQTVEVQWNDGTTVTLTGRDARAFLAIVKDRFAGPQRRSVRGVRA